MENLENDKSDEFKIFQPDEYETVYKILAPDNRYHYVVYNKLKDKSGYLYNKYYAEDDSHYAPYLMYTMAKKIGIDVPETELGIYLEKNINSLTYRDSFFESSLVYREGLEGGPFHFIRKNISFAHPKVILEIYQRENSEKVENPNIPIRNEMTVDEYINSSIYYLSRGNKRQYTEEENAKVKQELIDRLMFGLKFGIEGQTSILTYGDIGSNLDSYYLSSPNMFDLNLHYEWIRYMLTVDDKEFLSQIERNHVPQYGIKRGKSTPPPATKEVLEFVYKAYPKEAENAYKKISSYTRKDLEETLNGLKRLGSSKKEFALRFFDIKQKEFDEVYKKAHEKEEHEDR